MPAQQRVKFCNPAQSAGKDCRTRACRLASGVPEKRSHDYIRHGTTALCAALEAATGKVTGACYPQHRHQEFLQFLRQVARAYPRRKLHIVCDLCRPRDYADMWVGVRSGALAGAGAAVVSGPARSA